MKKFEIKKPVGDGWTISNIRVFSGHRCFVEIGEYFRLMLKPSGYQENIKTKKQIDIIMFRMLGGWKRRKETTVGYEIVWARLIDGMKEWMVETRIGNEKKSTKIVNLDRSQLHIK